jgi:hypothetical protein
MSLTWPTSLKTAATIAACCTSAAAKQMCLPSIEVRSSSTCGKWHVQLPLNPSKAKLSQSTFAVHLPGPLAPKSGSPCSWTGALRVRKVSDVPSRWQDSACRGIFVILCIFIVSWTLPGWPGWFKELHDGSTATSTSTCCHMFSHGSGTVLSKGTCCYMSLQAGLQYALKPKTGFVFRYGFC